MATIAASAPPIIWRRGEDEVSLVRLYVMRAGAVLGAVSLGSNTLPELICPTRQAAA